jgi:hypothetical protein
MTNADYVSNRSKLFLSDVPGAFHIACREVSDPRWLVALQRPLYLILIFAFNSF